MVAERNTWYFTVPPRKPSSDDAAQVIVTSARPTPLRRALTMFAGIGGTVSGPAIPSMQTWVWLAGPQLFAAS